LLARLLLSQKIDARHFSPAELDAGLPPGADPDGVSIIYLVSAFPSPERERTDYLDRHAQEMFPYAHVVRGLLSGNYSSTQRWRKRWSYRPHVELSRPGDSDVHCLAAASRDAPPYGRPGISPRPNSHIRCQHGV
jgi:hypothetical protein